MALGTHYCNNCLIAPLRYPPWDLCAAASCILIYIYCYMSFHLVLWWNPWRTSINTCGLKNEWTVLRISAAIEKWGERRAAFWKPDGFHVCLLLSHFTRLAGPADKPLKMALEDSRHRFQYHFMCFGSPFSIRCKWLVKECGLDLPQPYSTVHVQKLHRKYCGIHVLFNERIHCSGWNQHGNFPFHQQQEKMRRKTKLKSLQHDIGCNKTLLTRCFGFWDFNQTQSPLVWKD